MIHDVSLTLREDMCVWPGDPRPAFRIAMKKVAGDVANVTHISMCVHTGTHVDAPRHHLDDGYGADALRMDSLIGPAWVADLAGASVIDVGDLEEAGIPAEAKRVLIRTSNSKLWKEHPRIFFPDFVALTPNAAQWVVDREITLVGVDYLSVQRFRDPDPATHVILLGAQVVIVEGLDLAGVGQGWYDLVCLPVKIAECDGAPARVVLIDREGPPSAE